MDPLSDVFELLQIRALVSARFEACGDWAVRFPAQSYIKFATAARGAYWLTVKGSAPCRINQGDTYLMTNCPPYVIATDIHAHPTDGALLYSQSAGKPVRLGGDDVVILGGGFELDDNSAGILTDVLPPLLVIPAANATSALLHDTLTSLETELKEQRMGSAVVTSRLGEILLVQALRAYAEQQAPIGWLGAIGHPKIGTALRLLHSDVGKNWKIEELASAVGMSRSDFARKFKAAVGSAPLDYLMRWRMHLARRALRDREATVASIASSLGYSSESAFGNAFKRTFGRAPKRYWAQSGNKGNDGIGTR